MLDSIFEKSSTSFIIASSASPLLWIMVVYSFCSWFSGVCESSEVTPITPFIGVRISWLIVARKELLAWLARSASFLDASASLLAASAASLRAIISCFWFSNSSLIACNSSFCSCSSSFCLTTSFVRSKTCFSSSIFWRFILFIRRLKMKITTPKPIREIINLNHQVLQ